MKYSILPVAMLFLRFPSLELPVELDRQPFDVAALEHDPPVHDLEAEVVPGGSHAQINVWDLAIDNRQSPIKN